MVFSGGGTGGHLYPALALADALRELRPGVDAFFVGASRGLEARVLPERGEAHLLLPVVGFARDRPAWRRLGALGPFARGLWTVVRRFRALRPEAVVVTGGYAAGPAGLAAVLTGVPLVLQEQNAEPGLVTRTLSPFARQVHLAFPEAADRLPAPARERVRASGNPVRTLPGATDRAAARRRFGLATDGSVVLVVGGSQGAAALNRVLAEAIQGVRSGTLGRPEGLEIFWATGPSHLDAVREGLGPDLPGWVHLHGYIEDMPAALVAADVAVSRAGAMATSEFLAAGVPAILVPLPSAAAGHQARNAEALEGAGVAVHLPEERLVGRDGGGGAILWSALVALVADPERLAAMSGEASRRGRPNAAREIAEAVSPLLGPAASGRSSGPSEPSDSGGPGAGADR